MDQDGLMEVKVRRMEVSRKIRNAFRRKQVMCVFDSLPSFCFSYLLQHNNLGASSFRGKILTR